jgi:hypothetical protein
VSDFRAIMALLFSVTGNHFVICKWINFHIKTQYLLGQDLHVYQTQIDL